ncbi:hypothetical protein BSI_08030 [Bacillus inaquosorum KCTC 13429]|uniref:Uncharacterized protein n=1 Tax=Bacillus inaquosorum KCTC 13429 TaxID=1236548 RepID=A0A9W5LMG4_9BACI|nr:hypothetical protein BSI_08030 [Bacillus inaquosorum KCTC 13429]
MLFDYIGNIDTFHFVFTASAGQTMYNISIMMIGRESSWNSK